MADPLATVVLLGSLTFLPAPQDEGVALRWARAMHASREASAAEASAPGFAPVGTDVRRGGMEPVHLSADVTGLDRLWLLCDGVPDYHYALAVWGEARLREASGEMVRLCDLEPVSVEVGWGSYMRNRNHLGRPLSVGSRTFEHGVLPHADSAVCFGLEGRFVAFEAWVGVDAAAGTNGGVRFTVSAVAPDRARLAREVERIAAEHPAQARLIARLGTAWLGVLADAASRSAAFADAEEAIGRFDPAALGRAIRDLRERFGDTYDIDDVYLARLADAEADLCAVVAGLAAGEDAALARAEELIAFQREVLLGNPVIDFTDYLAIERRVPQARRPAVAADAGLPANWQSNSVLARRGWHNAIVRRGLRDEAAASRTVYEPADGAFVGDVDLHFDGTRMLFSSIGTNDRWQVFEVHVDGSGLRQVTRGHEPDVDNYDACYLPDGRVIYGSTAVRQGVPCVNASVAVANLFRMDADGGGARQLCFDQDDDWHPAVTADGRVMYTRWEYAGLPHSNSRLLFQMNPDGTGQSAVYGSNSFWPTALFFARPMPGGRFAGIVSGHHGVARMGELVVFDPARGRHEADGAVQRIPGWGEEVEAVVLDNLVDDSWPKFLHPFPLDDKTLLVAAKPTPGALWGIYLVDVFDNMLLLGEREEHVLFEPIPLRATPTPPVVSDRVDTRRADALIYMADVYRGQGLAGVPRGEVKELRLFTYTYLFAGCGAGRAGSIGVDGPWDMRRVLGTVPVEADGSACFRVPANTPLSVQPLDEDGKALQIMRSWMTAMPGEILSCVGCHESRDESPPRRPTIAAQRAPREITPWYGPTRGFTFAREVQPMLTRRCVACHDGTQPGVVDLRGDEMIDDWATSYQGYDAARFAGRFSRSYVELHRFVRRPGIESDIHLTTPLEFHADTTELVQLLAKGHHGVELSEEEWDRLITWIDLNAPFHGYWSDVVGEIARTMEDRRAELRARYAGVVENHEVRPPESAPRNAPEPAARPVVARGNPLAEWTAPDVATDLPRRSIRLGGGVSLDLVRIPAGRSALGGVDGGPQRWVEIERPFWMGTCEVTNEQYARLVPGHDSGTEPRHSYQFGITGYPVNGPQQPVVRVSLDEAIEWCARLSATTGETLRLPTEAEWEHACRAGTNTPFWYGDLDTDFAPYANFADARLTEFCQETYIRLRLVENPTKYDDWIPKDARFDDGGMLCTEVGRYAPNPWGLHDVHGNVAEWTTTPCPWDPRQCVVRGGSWYERPKRGTSAFRLGYRPYQKVFNVGFRVVCDAE